MAVAQRIGARHYMECSAISGEGVRDVFQYATQAALLVKDGRSRVSSQVMPDRYNFGPLAVNVV
jgi:hypothetical protein